VEAKHGAGWKSQTQVQPQPGKRRWHPWDLEPCTHLLPESVDPGPDAEWPWTVWQLRGPFLWPICSSLLVSSTSYFKHSECILVPLSYFLSILSSFLFSLTMQALLEDLMTDYSTPDSKACFQSHAHRYARTIVEKQKLSKVSLSWQGHSIL
jgi:hypothetical protein